MSELENAMVAGLPWLAAIGAVAMTGVAATRWRTLSDVNRAAVGLDAAVYAFAALPLARRQSTGWWMLYLATVIQPAFGGIEVARNPSQWPWALGRTAGAAVATAGLLRVRKSYA